MRQLPFFFLETNTHIHIRERERDSNTDTSQIYSIVIVTFKGRVRQVILHTIYFFKQYETITFFFFLRNKHTHTHTHTHKGERNRF